MKNGYVFIHKKIIEWQWFKFPYHLQMFVYLIAVASWKDGYLGREFIKRGSVVTSYRRLREDLGCSLEKVQLVLKDLETTGEIEKNSTSKNTTIRVKNYDQYQDVPSLLGVSYDDTLTDTLTDTPSSTQRGTLSGTKKGTRKGTQSGKQSERKAVTLNTYNTYNTDNTDNKEEEKEKTPPPPQINNNVFDVIKVEKVIEYFSTQSNLWRENTKINLHIGDNDGLLNRLVESYQGQLIATGVTEKNETDLRKHFLAYARKVLANDPNFKQSTAERMADATAYGISDRTFDNNW